MEYLVSAEDTPYYHWQLELLIQSFRMHGVQDKLTILLASENRGPVVREFRKLLWRHPRVFVTDNTGRRRGYPYLNKLYAMFSAVNQALVRQPFVVIEPDMVLFRPVPEPDEDVTFQVKPSLGLDLIEEQGCKVKEYLRSRFNDTPWLPLGSVYTFKNMPLDLFGAFISWAETLAFNTVREQIKSDQEPRIFRHTDRAAVAMTLLERASGYKYRPRYDLEMILLDHLTQNHFIHYTNGLPPAFTKALYRYEDWYGVSGGSETPFQALLLENPTSATNYMQWIVRSYFADTAEPAEIKPSEPLASG